MGKLPDGSSGLWVKEVANSQCVQREGAGGTIIGISQPHTPVSATLLLRGSSESREAFRWDKALENKHHSLAEMLLVISTSWCPQPCVTPFLSPRVGLNLYMAEVMNIASKIRLYKGVCLPAWEYPLLLSYSLLGESAVML